MNTAPSLKSDITYTRCLVQAVWDGVASVPERTASRRSTPVRSGSFWAPAAIGAAIGLWSASRQRRPQSGYRVAMRGLVGGTLGFGAGVAWASRDLTGAVARSTMQKVNGVRDARWLEKNPIAYA